MEAAEPRSIQPPSHTYSMARSMRLFPSALSPHSLASPSHPHWHLLSRETSTESLVGQQGDGVVIIRGSDPPSPSNSEPQVMPVDALHCVVHLGLLDHLFPLV